MISVKYSLVFLMLAASALWVAWSMGGVAVWAVALNVATAFGLLGLSYAYCGPRLLCKQCGGMRRRRAWPLYWPYFLLNGLSMALFRHGERHPPFVEIVPNLYLGRRLSAREVRQAETPRWRAVLDLAAEFPETADLRSRTYRSLPVLDATAPSLEQLSSAVDWLRTRVAEGPVYVHCALGHGRSATVVMGYLLATGQARTVDEAVAIVQSKRPGVKLVSSQWDVLRRYPGSQGASSPTQDTP